MPTTSLVLDKKTLSPDLLYNWRATNYLSVGQIYLYDNPLLKEPLKLSTSIWSNFSKQRRLSIQINGKPLKYLGGEGLDI